MSHFTRLTLTILIIFLSITAGYIVKHILESGKFSCEKTELDKWRLRAQTFAIFVLLPLAAMLSLWGLPKPDANLLLLPLLGLLTYTVGGGLALFFARIFALSRIQTGAFYCCGTFNNIGAIGSLVCLIFLGENSIALVALFRILEEIYYFGLSFPIARKFADKNMYGEKGVLNKNFIPILILLVCGLALGIILNMCHVERPQICGLLASISVLSATIIFLFTIGLTLRLSSVRTYLKLSLLLCLIKFCLAPLIIVSIAFLIGIETFDNGLALKVVAILSSMPVAMTALAPAAIFRLDLDLANSCWLISTAALLVVLPFLFYILPYI